MEALKNLIKEMLKKGIVQGIFAPVKGPGEGSVFPGFITTESEADGITLESYYPFSLAKLADRQVQEGQSVAIVATTCDVRALVELAKRKQVNLENVFLIGVECQAGGYSFSWCRRCEHLVPSMADVAFYRDGAVSINTEKGKEKAGEILSNMGAPIVEKREMPQEIKEKARQQQEEDFSELAKLDPADRLHHLFSLFDRCIKCYGCRNSCPLCFCEDCYLEPHKLIVKPGGNPPDKLFHLVRLMHIGYSCVNCGRCESACPVGIPVSRIYHELYKELSEQFGYEAGMDFSPLPLFAMGTEGEMK